MNPSATGVLVKTPFAHLLMYCFDKKVSGSLVLKISQDTDLEHSDTIYFESGYPAKIRILEPIERLGEIVREMGIIDDETFHRSLALLAQGKGLQGQILIQLGKLDEDSLRKGLQLQLMRKLGHLFKRAPETFYAYYNNVNLLNHYGGVETYPVNPRPVIWSGVRAHPSLVHIHEMVARVSHAPLHVRADFKVTQLHLTTNEQKILDQLSVTSMTPEELVQALNIEVNTVQRVLYTLLLIKQIEVLSRSSRTSVSSLSKQSTPTVKTDSAPVSSAKPWASMGVVQIGNKHAESEFYNSERDPISTRSRDVTTAATLEQRRHEIEEKVRVLNQLNFFELLNLTQDVSEADVKLAYFKLVKVWHPDRLPSELADLRDSVAHVFAAMTEAFQTLSHVDRKDEYRKTIAHRDTTHTEEEEVIAALEAANAFAKAEFFLSKNMFVEAQDYAQKAMQLEPKDPNYIAIWCWLQSMKPEFQQPLRLSELIHALSQAITYSPQCERAHLYRGMLLKKQGKIEDAMADFQCVLQYNPKHIEALREVRLYTMRQGKLSTLGRLFKKSHHEP